MARDSARPARAPGAVDIGAYDLASLVLIELDTHAESRVDSDVYYPSVDASRFHDERIVSYSVLDGRCGHRGARSQRAQRNPTVLKLDSGLRP